MHLSLFSLSAIDISYTGRSAYLKADKISGGVLRQGNIWNATRSIFYSNSSTGNWRIIQMGFINKSPTANFQREGRETWRIKAPGKRLSLSLRQHSQNTSLVTQRTTRRWSGEFSLQTKANCSSLRHSRAGQVGVRIKTTRGKGCHSKCHRKNGKTRVNVKNPAGYTPKLLGKTEAVAEATQIL